MSNEQKRLDKLKEYEKFLKQEEVKAKDGIRYSDFRLLKAKPIHYFNIDEQIPTELKLKKVRKKRKKKNN